MMKNDAKLGAAAIKKIAERVNAIKEQALGKARSRREAETKRKSAEQENKKIEKKAKFTQMLAEVIPGVAKDADVERNLYETDPHGGGGGLLGGRCIRDYKAHGRSDLQNDLLLANDILKSLGILHLEVVEGHEFTRTSMFGEILPSDFSIELRWKK